MNLTRLKKRPKVIGEISNHWGLSDMYSLDSYESVSHVDARGKFMVAESVRLHPTVSNMEMLEWLFNVLKGKKS